MDVLYRAVDPLTDIEFFLSTSSLNAQAAKCFFGKALGCLSHCNPARDHRDKNAAYPKALSELKAAEVVPQECGMRQVKISQHIIEQDHGSSNDASNRDGFFSLKTAWRTLQGYEVMNMLRKGR